jgi:AraC family transcriptional regulator
LIRIETIRRDVSSRVKWHFKQPELALFLYRGGRRKLSGTMNGRAFDQQFAGNLALYPPGVEIDGEFTVTKTRSDYTVVFFDPAFISERLPGHAVVPKLGFESPLIALGLEELCSEPHTCDDTFAMMAEGWAIQTVASLRRMGERHVGPTVRGGLAGANLKKVTGHIEENLGRPIILAELAQLSGLSTRHFIRAFSESTGDTPHQFVLNRRIERAKRLLSISKSSITEVGLEVGFSHSQHFTARFKRQTGVSPSRFRALTQ